MRTFFIATDVFLCQYVGVEGSILWVNRKP